MNWGYYLLEANLYLCVLYAFYRLLLQRETFYVLNRVYLLAIPFLAFAIPLVTVERDLVWSTGGDWVETSVVIQDDGSALRGQMNADPRMDWAGVAATVYIVVVMFLLLRLLWSIGLLLRTYHRGVKTHQYGITLVWMREGKEPFSFFRWLFVPRATGLSETVIAHELVHIRQWHSIDVLLLEAVRSVYWFNPFAHLLVRDARLNHEYLADGQASLSGGAYHYALLLIGHAYAMDDRLLGNPMFTRSQLKKRIGMLEKRKSTGAARLKYLLAMPLVAGLLAISGFAVEKDYGVFKLPSGGGAVLSAAQEDEPSVISRKPIHIDATTMRVRLYYADANSESSTPFEGIYVIGEQVYTAKELRGILDNKEEMVVLFPKRPVIGVYSRGDASAKKKWGDRAAEGVVFVQNR